MIQLDQDGQIRTTRKGQADRKDRTGLPAHHCQDSTARTGHLEQDRQDRIVETGQPEKESLNRTARMGKAKQDR
jgi:hypothetical protein